MTTDTPSGSKLAAIKGFIADLARPFAIYATSGATAWAAVDIGHRIGDGEGAAFYVAALFAGCSGLYWGKAFELTRIAGHSAEVEKVRAAASPPPAVALQPAEAAPPTAEPDAGELPADQRLNL